MNSNPRPRDSRSFSSGQYPQRNPRRIEIRLTQVPSIKPRSPWPPWWLIATISTLLIIGLRQSRRSELQLRPQTRRGRRKPSAPGSQGLFAQTLPKKSHRPSGASQRKFGSNPFLATRHCKMSLLIALVLEIQRGQRRQAQLDRIGAIVPRNRLGADASRIPNVAAPIVG